jgi:hypothetical protein
MALNFLDDVFSLHLALEAAQGILKGFAFLNTNFGHVDTPPDPPVWLKTGYALRPRNPTEKSVPGGNSYPHSAFSHLGRHGMYLLPDQSIPATLPKANV